MDLVILGASGSIGTQTINVIKNNEKKVDFKRVFSWKQDFLCR